MKTMQANFHAKRRCDQRKVDAYRGQRRPTCNEGAGCYACWSKYYAVQRDRRYGYVRPAS